MVEAENFSDHPRTLRSFTLAATTQKICCENGSFKLFGYDLDETGYQWKHNKHLLFRTFQGFF
jgi:hypothetical protein